MLPFRQAGSADDDGGGGGCGDCNEMLMVMEVLRRGYEFRLGDWEWTVCE